MLNPQEFNVNLDILPQWIIGLNPKKHVCDSCHIRALKFRYSVFTEYSYPVKSCFTYFLAFFFISNSKELALNAVIGVLSFPFTRDTLLALNLNSNAVVLRV